MFTSTAHHVGLLALSALTTAVLAGYATRNRRVQGAWPFAALMVAFTLYSTFHLAGLLTLHPRWRLLWENIQWIATALTPVFWLVFAMEYTGYEGMITPRTVGAMSLVPLVTIVLTWTNPVHGLMWAHNTVAVVDGLAIMEQNFGPWFWMHTVYTYGCVGVGTFLLVRLIWLSDYLYTDQSVLLVVGIAAPVLASVMTIFRVTPIPEPALDMTPYAFAVSGIAFGYALFHRRLFELVPATRQLGRNAAIAQLEDGVAIVDSALQIVYLNATAAEIFDAEPEDALGRPVDLLVDRDVVDFDSEDALATLERDDRTYEVRTSPISGRRDQPIGHTLVIHDVTARERRERRLARQRDELETLDDLNAVVRGVNRALVSATTREEIDEAVCERLADSDLYATACAADVPTWCDEADRWTVAGEDGDASPPPATLRDEGFDPGDRPHAPVAATSGGDPTGAWTVVPLVYGRTVYGALGLYTSRETVSDREREVLSELGELIGHAINAVETRRLLAAESVVELELGCGDDDSPLVAAGREVDARLAVSGLVPGADDGHAVYVRVEDGSVETARDSLTAAADGSVRVVRGNGDGGLLEWSATGDALLGTLVEHGANVLRGTAGDGTGRFVVEVPSDADARSLLDHVRRAFPETWLDAKREHERPIDRAHGIPATAVEELTDRQQEALEAAYRAGYFDWPRESTAEEVAESLDIAAPTLHGHLRKAEASLITDLFESEASERP